MMLNLTVSLLEQTAILPLPKSIQPSEQKQLSAHQAIRRLPLAERLIIPLQQHAGPAGKLRVQVGQRVQKGEPLTQGIGPRDLPVHASASGWITAIRSYADPLQPQQRLQLPPPLCIELRVDDTANDAFSYPPLIDYWQQPHQQLLQRAYEAGLAGLGGAGFPSSAKWNCSPSATQLLIINAMECEPYITADDRLMREQATAVLQGCHILHHLLQPKQTVLAIEDNKPQALAALQRAFNRLPLTGDWLQFRQLPTRYPSGDAHQLITLLTGISIPQGQHSSQLGIVVHNVATLFALQQAVITGKPLIERVVTITGEAFIQPGNYWVHLGTPVNYLLQQLGVATDASVTVRVGGPLMGKLLLDLQAPVIKTTNCLLVQPTSPSPTEQPCIRCGECATVCPIHLLPQQLYWSSRDQVSPAAQAPQLLACIECGACNSVCPSHIPLVNYFQQAKAAWKQQTQQTLQARKAKERFQAKQQRLVQQQQRRRQTLAEASLLSTNDEVTLSREIKTPLADFTPASSDNRDRQSAVAAALARAKSRKIERISTTDATNS